MREIPNNMVAVIALTVMVASVLGNWYFIEYLDNSVTVQAASGQARISLCVNRDPSFNFPCNTTIINICNYSCNINASDPDGNLIFYYDNADFFNISPEGWINFTTSHNLTGNHSVLVGVNDSVCPGYGGYEMVITFEMLLNQPPYLAFPLPNISWPEDQDYTGLDLDDYFVDPDGDPLIYDHTFVDSIDIFINNLTNIITYHPYPDFFGNRTVYFFAYDPYGASATSNRQYLTVIPVAEPDANQDSGGGGGGSTTQYEYICEPYWDCTRWGPCLITGIRRRTCVDLAECGTDEGKPDEVEKCEYIGTCADGVRNFHEGLWEEKVDCGGPCPPCPSCTDSVLNQGEERVNQHLGNNEFSDCGGPLCPVCPSCEDGILNQNEIGVDCGGVCSVCQIPQIEIPGQLKEVPPELWLFWLILIIVTSSFVYRYGQPYYIEIVERVRWYFILKGRLKNIKLVKSGKSITIIKKLDLLEKNLSEDNTEAILNSLSDIVREYFKILFKIDYEFTYEELIFDIQHMDESRIKQVLIPFSKKLTELVYGGKKIDKEYVEKLIKVTKYIILETTEFGKTRKK